MILKDQDTALKIWILREPKEAPPHYIGPGDQSDVEEAYPSLEQKDLI